MYSILVKQKMIYMLHEYYQENDLTIIQFVSLSEHSIFNDGLFDLLVLKYAISFIEIRKIIK